MPIAKAPPGAGDLVQRHALPTRLWHWASAALMIGLLMSGLNIFNAHPRLYWGQAGAHFDPAWLEIGAADESGFVRIGTWQAPATGLFGYSDNGSGENVRRAFPSWATLPSRSDLARARDWHLGFAWLFAVGTFVFGIWTVLGRHMRRDLMPRLAELGPRSLWRHCKDHARLRVPDGSEALHYNVLQKLAYLGVTGVLLPLVILTGFCMSPMLSAAFPWLVDLFGGRQSARSLHFIGAFSLLVFVGLHLTMVLVAGPINTLRSMITGWFRIPEARDR